MYSNYLNDTYKCTQQFDIHMYVSTYIPCVKYFKFSNNSTVESYKIS